MQFTGQQQTAIFTTDTNLILTAGAGSGKTRVLVERFMTLLATHQDWPLTSIVAITFTEKAAREMRDRIRQAITQRLASSQDDIDLWQDHAAALDSARIGTIHSLCAQLLRANPVEAQLDPGFQVLDEVEAALLRREAVEIGLENFLQTPDAQLFFEYDVLTVQRTLYDFTNQSLADQFNDTLAANLPLDEHWQRLWQQDSQAMLQTIRDDADLHYHLHWIDSLAIRPTTDKLWAYWDLVIAHRDALRNDDPASVVDALDELATIKINVGSAKNWGDKTLLQDARNELRIIRERCKTYRAQCLPQPNELDNHAAQLLQWWNTAIQFVATAYRELKAEQNSLDFDDLENRTVHLLEQHPTVAARYVQGEFNHIMVDEFQDTNDIQRRIIYAICGIDLIHHTAPPGRLFVVGDPKQSIYAFRGADVSVFDRVRREIVSTGGQMLALSTSFRSHARLIAMFNAVFSQVLQPASGPMAHFHVNYEPMMHHRPSETDHQTPLSLLILQRPQDDTRQFFTEDLRRWEATALAEQLQAMIAAETPVWDKETSVYRPIEYGDIALLFQSMNHTPIYENVFQQFGLPYLTIAGKGYFERQEVWDVMNLLAALHNPADDLALASILRSPMFGLSDDALFALRLRRQPDTKALLPLWEAFMINTPTEDWPLIPDDDLSPLAFARSTLTTLQNLVGRVTIAELLEAALEATAFEATLTALPAGNQRRANINKLLDVARRSRRVSLGDFNAYLRDMIATEPREGEAPLETESAISLMSVHKSKGLEFPVVVLADCSWNRRADSSWLLLDPLVGPTCKLRDSDDQPFAYQLARKYAAERDLAERRRLFYVAATRAQDYLIISGQHSKSETNAWLDQLRRALHLPTTGVLEHTPTNYHEYEWGHLALSIPNPPADLYQWRESSPHTTLWDSPPTPVTDRPTILSLLQPIQTRTPGDRWHINATDLEKLGRIPYAAPPTQARADFQRAILRDMPGPIRPITHTTSNEPLLAYTVGQIVHRALRVGLLPSRKHLDVQQSLSDYAWELGITTARLQHRAVERAYALLEQYETSTVSRTLDAATEVYREIEFVLDYGKYIIHGVIDTLFKFDGHWHVLDYKTSRISGNYLPEFSRRYHYQMGAYAAAVEQQTSHTPLVSLHYLHPNRTYQLPESDWRAAIASLSAELDTTLQDSSE